MRKEQSNGVDERRCEPSVAHGDCLEWLQDRDVALDAFDLTFLDPPFNQGKEYDGHDDSMPGWKYWDWMAEVCNEAYRLSSDGAAIYFMQREKNTEEVLRVLRETGWTGDDLPTGWFKWRDAPNVIRDVDEYRSIASAFDDVVPEAAGSATGFVLRHPFNGPFLVVQLPLNWR